MLKTILYLPGTPNKNRWIKHQFFGFSRWICAKFGTVLARIKSPWIWAPHRSDLHGSQGEYFCKGNSGTVKIVKQFLTTLNCSDSTGISNKNRVASRSALPAAVHGDDSFAAMSTLCTFSNVPSRWRNWFVLICLIKKNAWSFVSFVVELCCEKCSAVCYPGGTAVHMSKSLTLQRWSRWRHRLLHDAKSASLEKTAEKSENIISSLVNR